MVDRRVQQPDEIELVERARHGDVSAFGELVEIYQHEVFTLAVRMTGDRTLAADVAQEAFIRAFRSIGSFRGDAALGTWLHRITVNVAWTQLGRVKRRRTEPEDSATDQPDLSAGASPEVMAESSLLRSRLTSAVGELPPGQRSVVVLKDVYGWSHAEIAEELGISVTATKVRLHRAHQKLRSILGGDT